MSDLRALQTELAQAMLSPQPAPPASLCADALADVDSRLSIYHRGYRLRLRDALSTEFPGLALMMGRRFAPMLDRYVEAHPSTHYNIRWHGAGLADFLGQTSPWREQPALADMARLDWAISTVFDAADETAIGVADLAAVPPEAWATLRLRPLAHLQWLTLGCNADAFRRAADQGGHRPALRRLRRPRQVLVWRPSLDVRYRQLQAHEIPVLRGLLGGESFGELCEGLAQRHAPATAPQRMVTHLTRWLGEGLIGRLEVAA